MVRPSIGPNHPLLAYQEQAMHLARQVGKSLLIFVGVVLPTGSGNAQPLSITLWTIEARMAQADHVVVGVVEKVSRKVIVAPGGPDKIGVIYPDGQFEYTVTLKIGEVLKGDLPGTVDDLAAIHSGGADNRYEEWSKAQTPILWFLGPTPKAGARRQWGILPLGKRVAAEDRFGKRETPLYSKDFTVLKNDEEVLARARAYGKMSRQVQPTHAIEIPHAFVPLSSGGRDLLIVPVEPTLEQRAQRLIASPEDFVPKGKKLDSPSRDLLRLGGVNSLRHFKSDANVGVLLKIKNSNAQPLSIRTKAYEVLSHWDVDVPLPKWAQEITSLHLAGTGVTDKGLKQLAELNNLATLDLQDTKVTDAGLKQLASLKKLTSLGLSEAQLSDANLRVLREIGLLHCLSQASAGRGPRPKSAEEVVSLALCRGPVTDSGLRELEGLKNLAWLDLRATHVTDAGLKELAALKKLVILLLQDTRVTNAGVAELRKPLPKCEIRWKAE